MDVIGIICEYNPFHNGHKYFIDKIKKQYPNSILILVLNGYFLERGEASILSKEDKVDISLKYNIDIILELPAIFGTQSADIFAKRSVEILNHFKIDKIIFGSECNDISLLETLASKQMNDDYQSKVKDYLKQGLNYPTALAKALNTNVSTPNDLLGISYIKAIKSINPNIKYETIKRTNDYHDLDSNCDIISASNIRNKLNNNQDIINYLPFNYIKRINKIDKDLYFKLLKMKIITEDDLSIFMDVDEGIENKLKKEIFNSNTLEEFIKNIKSKRYTYNKINRMLFHILIGFKKKDNIKTLEYIKILGFNKTGQSYINNIKKNIDIPLKPIINSKTYTIEKRAAYMYELISNNNVLTFEKNNKPIIKRND